MRALLAAATLVAVPVVADAQGVRIATVRSTDAPLFGAPSAGAPVLDNCEKGSVLRVLRVSEDWVKVATDEGRVGFMPKVAVVPGRWQLDRPDLGSRPGSGAESRLSRARPSANAPRARAERSPIVTQAGVAFVTNTHAIDAGRVKERVGGGDLPMLGLDASAEWWPHRWAGGRVRVTSAYGTTGGQIPGASVSRIPAALDRLEADAVARTRVRPADVPLRLTGGLGVRVHQLRVDPVVREGAPVFLVGRSYRGLALSGRAETPIAGPDRTVFVALEHWLGASVNEARGTPTGKPGAVSASALALGGRFGTDRLTVVADLRYQVLAARFGGTGERFGEEIAGAKTSDRSTIVSATALWRF